jgi:hypothetical protein
MSAFTTYTGLTPNTPFQVAFGTSADDNNSNKDRPDGPWGDIFTLLAVDDWGDLPGPYPTLAVNSGPSHTGGTNEWLGSTWDAESDGQPHSSALGDDISSAADEAGVVFINGQYQVTMSVLDYTDTRYDGGTDATNVHLRGFIDLNNDGDFNDAGEQVSYSGDPNTWGGNTHVETFTPTFANGQPGQIPIYSRWRFAYGTDLAVITSPTGAAATGEVEDYVALPEPATVALLLGGLGLLARKRRGRKAGPGAR